MVQPMLEWRPPVNAGDAVPETLVAYPSGAAQRVDALSLASFPKMRTKMLAWRSRPAAGTDRLCVSLFGATKAVAVLGPEGLKSPTAPFVLIADELRCAGWAMGTLHGPHMPDSPKILTLSGSEHRKAYFQCLLSLREWFDQGLPRFPRSQSMAYYALMLNAPSAVYRNAIETGKSAAFYQERLKELRDGKLAYVPFHAVQHSHDHLWVEAGDDPAHDPRIEGIDEVGDDAALDLDVVGNDSDIDDAPAPAAPAADVPPAAADVDGAVGGDGGGLEWPAQVVGCPLRYNFHIGPRGSYERLVITCGKHPDCFKSRNLGPAQCKNLGPREPLAYLAVWGLQAHQYEEDDKAGHNKFRPTVAAMRAWLETNP